MPSSETHCNSIAVDKLRGVPAIAKFIGESERRTYYLLENGILPAAKEGAIWITFKTRLTKHYDALMGGGK